MVILSVCISLMSIGSSVGGRWRW